MHKIVLAVNVWLLCIPAYAKQVTEAVTDMQSVSDTDPNGFKWMIVCISLLVLVASSLIVATIMYGINQKKKSKPPQ